MTEFCIIMLHIGIMAACMICITISCAIMAYQETRYYKFQMERQKHQDLLDYVDTIR